MSSQMWDFHINKEYHYSDFKKRWECNNHEHSDSNTPFPLFLDEALHLFKSLYEYNWGYWGLKVVYNNKFDDNAQKHTWGAFNLFMFIFTTSRTSEETTSAEKVSIRRSCEQLNQSSCSQWIFVCWGQELLNMHWFYWFILMFCLI